MEIQIPYHKRLDLKQWCELDELIHISQVDVEYMQYAGLDFKKEIIERLAAFSCYWQSIL
jgi:hypothetical protein